MSELCLADDLEQRRFDLSDRNCRKQHVVDQEKYKVAIATHILVLPLFGYIKMIEASPGNTHSDFVSIPDHGSLIGGQQ
jgi:hypothetical protein